MASVRPSHFFLWLCLLRLPFYYSDAEAKCTACKVALGNYYVNQNYNITYISSLFDNEINYETLKNWNSQTQTITGPNFIQWGYPIRIPFSCDCLGEGNNRYLGHMFHYTLAGGDTYDKIANTIYANLTTVSALQNVNSYPANSIPDGATLNVSINCSCGDASISKAYGLFLTYPLNATIDNLAVLTNTYNVRADLLEKYNPTVNFTDASGIAFVPNQDPNGSYLPIYPSGGGIGPGTIAGISIGIAFALLLIAFGMFYIYVYKHKKAKKSALLHMTGVMSTESVALAGNTTQGFTDITVDKSVEFTYQELAEATSDFSIANKIGEGGFGAVYYAELKGEKAAIKKMDMQATKEFLAELKVLTHVHHLNLLFIKSFNLLRNQIFKVRLIGFCIEECLFLVYEFIENGNLSQHLHGSGMEPLSWPARVQIALDSARGLEYIHEHTVPLYIHRDIKSANILIDRNSRAKVADFGLTKLTEVGGASAAFPTRLVGTFGYMPPEYAQFGEVSPKVDVYAFGVVLYEIISAKEAIVRIDDDSAESKGLVTLFESILKDPNGRESLRSLIDPRLGNNYMLDSVWKMAQLARACTQENPHLRPSMRTVVVALMTLSSSTEDWDVGSFYENQAIVNLMGR